MQYDEVIPIPLLEQFATNCSLPVQETESIRAGPVPLPKREYLYEIAPVKNIQIDMNAIILNGI